jgi:ribosomal protein L40E
MNPLKWRKMTWAILLFTVAMVAWTVAFVDNETCSQYAAGTTQRENCELGEDIGTGIGGAILAMIWLVGFLVLSVIWFMTRRGDDRVCPACGTTAKTGRTTCKKCGYDYAAAAPTPTP